MQLLPGVGQVTATKLLDALDESPDSMSAMEAFKNPCSAEDDSTPFLAVNRALRAPTSNWPAEMEIVTRWYEPHFNRIYEDAFVRQGDLAQLQQIAATYSSRERFLTEVTLDPPQATSDHGGEPGKDDDYLILSTIH